MLAYREEPGLDIGILQLRSLRAWRYGPLVVPNVRGRLGESGRTLAALALALDTHSAFVGPAKARFVAEGTREEHFSALRNRAVPPGLERL